MPLFYPSQQNLTLISHRGFPKPPLTPRILWVSLFYLRIRGWNFPGGPVVKNPPCNAGDCTGSGSIPSQGTKIPCAVGQLSPHPTVKDPTCHNWDLTQPKIRTYVYTYIRVKKKNSGLQPGSWRGALLTQSTILPLSSLSHSHSPTSHLLLFFSLLSHLWLWQIPLLISCRYLIITFLAWISPWISPSTQVAC